MEKVTAAVVRVPGGAFEMTTLSLEDPRPGEVRVRMVAVGVCHADLIARDQIYPVKLPAVLGHEGAGIVEQVADDVQDLQVGDEVVLSFNYCAECETCRAGFPGNCLHTGEYNFAGVRPDGSSSLGSQGGPISSWFFGQSSFATAVNVTSHLAVKVESGGALPYLAPLGCSFMTGIGTVWNVLKPDPGTSIAIFGAGGVGLSALAAAKSAGCEPLIVIDVADRKLARASALGATHVINPSRHSAVQEIGRITANRGVSHAIDATGSPAVFGTMLDCLATRGHGVLVGAPAPGERVTLELNHHLSRGVRASFVLEGDADPRQFIPLASTLAASGTLDLEALVEYFPFEDINAAVARVERGEITKAVLLFPPRAPETSER